MSGTPIELAVHDAEARDGRPIARLPEPARRRLGVLSGDAVIVAGDERLVATVWPAGRDVPGGGIGLDAAARRRAGVDTGGTVTVRAARIDDADVVVVRLDGAVDGSALRSALRDRPVDVGDRFRVDGTTLRVLRTVPDGPVRVTDATSIDRRGGGGEAGESGEAETGGGGSADAPAAPTAGTRTVTYDDIGGLDEELELVREMVELPLSSPERFERLGIEPPTGVLLYGPPGTGKTLIAEAVASSVDAAFYHVSGPEITSKYKGESEERLREIFDRARERSPSIVFFDEIDAIASERDERAGMESRVVAQLLSLMDGLEARGRVIVIGATNRVDALDPALRRPGRFDREIEIGVPDAAGRRAILDIQLRNVPLAADVDVDRLAARTHGFVGADLRALVTESAMAALRRTDEDDELVVTRADVESALAAVDPSAMREFVVEVPETGFADVGGLEDAKGALREAVEWPLAYPRLFEETATDPPTGILLYGPPGTGKTLLARATARESEVNFIHVAGPELIDKYVGESEKAVREVFDRARQAAPTLVFFDEIDAIASRRGDGHEVTERVVSQLLTELDGLTDSPNLVVLAATNRREALDPALLRPGRLETHVEVPRPDEAARREILSVHTRAKPLGDDVDLDALAVELDGATGADVEALCREASMLAIREAVAERGLDEANDHADEIVIRGSHFEAANRDLDLGRG